MPRENSFSDDGRSLTPDLSETEDDRVNRPPQPQVDVSNVNRTQSLSSTKAPKSPLRSRLRMHPATQRTNATTHNTATPTERFRTAARKVMAMRRTSTFLSGGGAAGAEPGVDVRKDANNRLYGAIRAKCLIEVIDYSPLRTQFTSMNNGELTRWAENWERSERPAWSKVRWINVAGISYDVIRALALRYDMHPLALEDLLHQRAQAKSKADYFTHHLFLRVLCHTIGDSSPSVGLSTLPQSSAAPTMSSAKTLTDLPRSSSPVPLDSEKPGDIPLEERPEYDGPSDPSYSDPEAGAPSLGPGSMVQRSATVEANKATLAQLKAGDRVDVRIAPLSIFMFPDGTIITFYPATDLSFTAPIMARIRHRDSQLRRSGDASLLLQSLLDLTVDRILEVTEEYHRRILQLERIVLIKPKVSTVRSLHILSGDLILHKRTMDPIKTLVYGLRRYDADRCAASMALEPGQKFSYLSQKANIYLADVNDHMDYALSSLDMYAAMTENLIGYTFNMASYDMNQVMKSLTLVTVIFFPLTLLTGYFGMNFIPMWSLRRSDLFFWEVAIPVMVVCVPVFLWQDLVRMIHFIKKRFLSKQIKKDIRKNGKWRKA